MATGALYGAFLGTLTVVLTTVLPPAIGWCLFWGALSVQLSVGAAVVWRRTRLPLMTAALTLGACTSSGFSAFAAGGVIPQELLARNPWLLGGLMVLAPVLLFSESWFHADRWAEMKRRSARATFGDVLTFRHIPDLRQTGPHLEDA
jgi:hypothetical protein